MISSWTVCDDVDVLFAQKVSIPAPESTPFYMASLKGLFMPMVDLLTAEPRPVGLVAWFGCPTAPLC